MSSEDIFYLPVKVRKEKWLLNNGIVFPNITLGVTHLEGFENIYKAVNTALACGYRSFDCSPSNSCEEFLGRTLEELLPVYNLERKDISLSCKIHPKDYGIEQTSEAFLRSCTNLKTNYIDLFLMQWPGGHNLDPEVEDNQYLREETWNEIVRLNSEGVIKSIGVCHFNCRHLESIRKCSNKIPAVNQVEYHPKCPQPELVGYCAEKNIQLQAAAFRETFNSILLDEEPVKRVATRLNKSPTQIVLKWILNKGVGVITQSESPKRIRQYFQLYDFVLEKPDMDSISAIRKREKYLRSPVGIV